MGTRLEDEEEEMNCAICKNGETSDGFTTVTLSRNGTTLVFKGVPARICGNCGEDYVDESIAERLLSTAEEASLRGVEVDVRQYVA